ncbi:glycoside hydrolase family 31 protein [Butyrivibrio sp. LC3010]|uniref:glycoside hydrolase family 31 protein n=1 Tax=Butyrivibrio sp. LC3010 TaxID=1280680 RepID=UPI0004197A40|nr:glycoside hydrolase family 31 protein [Butyrivibrio sp. LC3010]
MIIGEKYRISIMTDRLIRLEYAENGVFEDRLSKTVVNRNFPEVRYSEKKTETGIEIETDSLIIRYDEQPFSTDGLSIELKDSGNVWHYSITYGNSDENLFGTARTLDGCDGGLWLEEGIFGRRGFAVMNDSASPVVVSSGDGTPGSYEYAYRETEGIDIYFFGYGKDFFGGLKAFYSLCGKTPLIPRYALGNWWSRYFRYTEESYKEVVDKFEELEIPLSVAVIDMDWHVTDVDPKYGTGWTGYSWNKELFPDPARFLSMLHERGLATTLNLHPADGIRAFEDMYEEMAKQLGVDPSSERPLEFDFSDPEYRKAYFDVVMHPYEKEGVDFWWIDWQQGTGKGADSVDPLFLLNHYHYHDQEGRNRRPMIFSRYAGPGSHRYPVGFSGDTVMTWKSLNFQPYFTSTASNIGYGFWSHDIGGHMMGDKDNERLIRWIQYGVFSPVMRLHSSSSPFLNKEPWVIEEPYHSIMGKYMRLRHRLLPYLYTESYRAYDEDRPLIRPMYYLLPEDERAYKVPTEYGFGEKLIVGAITSPIDKSLQMSAVNMLLPEGRWYDIFSGRIYKGGKMRKLYRKLTDIPVLIGEGGIVPMSLEDKKNGVENPASLRLCIGAGKDGSYTMYEDDGISMEYKDGKFVKTTFDMTCSENSEGKDISVRISPAEGELSLVKDKRTYEICIYGVEPCGDKVTVCTGSNEDISSNAKYDPAKKILTVYVGEVETKEGAGVTISGIKLSSNDHKKQVFDIVEFAWIEIITKDKINDALNRYDDEGFLTWLNEADISETLKDAIREIY